MAGVRQILKRRNAAENIRKVTGTMETISAVRYRRYYKRWAQGVDFYDSLARLAYLMITAKQAINHPLLAENESKDSALVIIGSDRGLCGAHNHNIFRLLDVHINMARRFGRKLHIYAKGAKVLSRLNNMGVEPAGKYDDFDEVPGLDKTKQIAEGFIEQYINARIGRLSIVYTRFFSGSHQQAQTLSVLPVAELIDDLTTRATVIWPWELSFEDFLLSPSAEEVFESLVHMMVSTVIQGCFLEAALSEHMERVVAMRSATDNAEEMIENLTKEYNRARQTQITTELLDIIGGAAPP